MMYKRSLILLAFASVTLCHEQPTVVELPAPNLRQKRMANGSDSGKKKSLKKPSERILNEKLSKRTLKKKNSRKEPLKKTSKKKNFKKELSQKILEKNL